MVRYTKKAILQPKEIASSLSKLQGNFFDIVNEIEDPTVLEAAKQAVAWTMYLGTVANKHCDENLENACRDVCYQTVAILSGAASMEHLENVFHIAMKQVAAKNGRKDAPNSN
jgi:hypothetical protein